MFTTRMPTDPVGFLHSMQEPSHFLHQAKNRDRPIPERVANIHLMQACPRNQHPARATSHSTQRRPEVRNSGRTRRDAKPPGRPGRGECRP